MSSQSNLTSEERELPRLPVPTLERSSKEYLNSVVPLIIQKYGQSSLEECLRKIEILVNSLCEPGGLGVKLQNRLIDVERRSPNNWLNDNYWISCTYHSWRVGLPINSNWWIILKHDRDIPLRIIENLPDPGRFTDWQIRRAATMVHRMNVFRQMIDRGEILPDSSRAARWQRHWILNSLYGVTRIPAKPFDHLNLPNKSSKHIVVLAKDSIYSLNVLSDELDPLPAKQIESRLWAIINDVTSRPTAASIGCLTGLDRDRWTDAREHLLLISPTTNRKSLSTIEDALFAVCLDDSTQSGGIRSHIRVASSNHDGSNRWFDKSLSLIIENNSRASVMGEHSPCDALIPAIIVDFVMADGVGSGLCDPAVKTASHHLEPQTWNRLDWVTDSKISEYIEEARKYVSKASEDSDGSITWFKDYGADYIRQSAKFSPDAYVQMAIQLAWYRQIGSVTSTYETALTRLFKHGRTDVIRSLSKESYLWVKSMSRRMDDVHGVYNLFAHAISAHNKYTKDASLGRAFDRHFLGLKLQHRPDDDGPLPELFRDEMFGESSKWELSTSGLSAGERFIGTGFGCYGKGYGINYLIGSKLVKFGIETKRSDERTGSEEFGSFLIEALRDIRELCERATGQNVEEWKDDKKSLPKSHL
ncbi:acyltransferase ChoActase/COT/CPT [Phakopsora pachyrhizi]|uniref:Acyltransferase ChoActase/COT/CPT n=1 Tax=Phakopsora pachyrhizi TaxID=170000 RepID=A0AAV0BH82_PHAPC|nr:acyltransferase ChoActase/COT/CPT [Phakopsora pachyrhizi]CAH7686690.1 acyltransferase ChoActase/COT/CPT [Phakopsora pachyrhizi]